MGQETLINNGVQLYLNSVVCLVKVLMEIFLKNLLKKRNKIKSFKINKMNILTLKVEAHIIFLEAISKY